MPQMQQYAVPCCQPIAARAIQGVRTQQVPAVVRVITQAASVIARSVLYQVVAARIKTMGHQYFFTDSKTKIRDITDGTSNTMMVSELLVGSEYINYGNVSTGGILDDCSTAGSTSKQRGQSWFYGDASIRWAFLTVFPPNTEAACRTYQEYANASPASKHVGGVHILLCDGGVRFVSDNIHLKTWQDLGNKADENVLGEF